ncbi:lauroyl-Kdo(2)-lipid IV(A) myristoyltransferase [Photobacterium sp. 1_MG-2023]|uniref:lauroyl-Kdo(2)-lipid IV(A) myristoyltransferase n=1 Tax=Photobacterium sp. 1_MG-2023 TaxID=3062646 RepID=UPI0026E17BDA|nr:lauroyl-Kdo(2)-lipid IV(A) myristoyltransferase [Photobacterium sp. 1_MG-2023]MDO6706283.1 lauroyl-Kdo(2)-lipid IV(A) myristoyltransferase [Photobacterium sp. 1_MG-2023]
MKLSRTIKPLTNQGYRPRFQWSFLHPKHWGTWISIGFLMLFALIPWQVRDPIAGKLGKFIGRRAKKARQRAQVNLTLCFPEQNPAQREAMIDDMFAVATQVILAMGELTFKSKSHLQNRTLVVGREHLDRLIEEDRPLIMLVPHAWAIDFPGIYWASLGLPIAALMKPQHRQPVYDWLISKQRLQYGGACYTREEGLKPYLKAIKQGYMGYYLPDEDFGPEQSQFTDFFATKKATFAGLGKIVRMTGATVVPMMPVYNAETGKFEIHISPALEELPTNDLQRDAEILAHSLESMVAPTPSQYMWNLRLLKTRPDNEPNPYQTLKIDGI